MPEIKFVHTNIVARDWKSLAKFYVNVFGCKEKKPERNLSGKWLNDLTGIQDAHIRGIHLLLPGYDDNGPTLEIFEYDKNEKNTNKKVNCEGLGHTAFAVDDVERCLADVLKNGGSKIGTTVKGIVDGVGEIHVVYAKDPEGNIIEIQKWE